MLASPTSTKVVLLYIVSMKQKMFTMASSDDRLVRTWRGGDYGFGEVLDGTGKVVKGVSEVGEQAY